MRNIKSVICVLMYSICHISIVQAKELHVDSRSPLCDDSTSAVYCHITAAIAAANDGDVIQIASGVYLETLLIDKNLSLNGSRDAGVIINGQSKATVLIIEPGVKSKVSNITLENGKGEKGGGILNSGSLLLSHCEVRNNVSLTSGGGIFNASSVSGSLIIESSRIDGNISLGYDELHVKYGGGGIYNNAPMHIVDSIIVGNVAVGNGGGVYTNFAGRKKPTDAQLAAEKLGVVAAAGSVTTLQREMQEGATKIINSQLIGNVAEAGGGIYVQGAIDISAVVLESNSAVFGDRSAGGGIFAHFDAALKIENTRIRKNMATFVGGGIRFYSTRAPKLQNIDVSENTLLTRYGRGAGIYILKGAADVELVNSALTNNLIDGKLFSDCDGKARSGGFNYLGSSKRCELLKTSDDFVFQ